MTAGRSAAVALAVVAVAVAPTVARGDEASPAPASAGVCADPIRDPLEVGLLVTGLDAPRGACPRSLISVRSRARALIATDDFYGTVGGGLGIDVRIDKGPIEWGLGARLVDATFVQNAVITATDLEHGPLSGHAAWIHGAAVGGRRLHLAALARIDLPLTTVGAGTTSGGLQLAEIATLGLGDAATVHGRAAVVGWFASSSGGTSTRGAALASLDVVHRVAWSRLAGQLGAEVQGGWYGTGLDHVAVRGALQVRLAASHRMALGAVVPLAGDDRTDAVVAIDYHHDL